MFYYYVIIYLFKLNKKFNSNINIITTFKIKKKFSFYKKIYFIHNYKSYDHIFKIISL